MSSNPQAAEAAMADLLRLFGALGTALSSCEAANPRLQRIHEIRASLKQILDDHTLTPE